MASLTTEQLIPWCCCGCQHWISSPEPWTLVTGNQGLCVGRLLSLHRPQLTLWLPAPGAVTSVSAALLLLEPAEASEPSLVLQFYHSDSSMNRAPGSPAGFLDPKMPQPTQGSFLSLGCSLSTRLTLTVQAGATGLLTETQVDGKPGREPQPIRGLLLENRQMLNNPPESINS